MRARSANCRKLLWSLAWGAALGCGGDQGPFPTVRLSIQGQVLSADPTPVAVAGAIVALRHFKGLLGNPESLAETSTDQAGNYRLTYTSTSACEPTDNTTDWIEASADGYETASTFASPAFSDPVIYCTDEPQVINLSLQPFGALQVITNTSGSGLDPDGYALHLGGGVSGGVDEYPMGLNDQLILSQLRPGQYSLELTDVAGNCTVAEDNPRTVTMAGRDTTVSTFQVACGL